MLLQSLKFTNFFPKWGVFELNKQALLGGPLAGTDFKSTYSSAPFDSGLVFHLRLILPTLHSIIALIGTAQHLRLPTTLRWISSLPSRADIQTRFLERRGGTSRPFLKH